MIGEGESYAGCLEAWFTCSPRHDLHSHCGVIPRSLCMKAIYPGRGPGTQRPWLSRWCTSVLHALTHPLPQAANTHSYDWGTAIGSSSSASRPGLVTAPDGPFRPLNIPHFLCVQTVSGEKAVSGSHKT